MYLNIFFNIKILQIFFKPPKKQENAGVAEEIKITHVINYYNDSLENDNYEEEEEEKEEKDIKEEKLDNNNVEEVIEVKKDDLEKNKKIKQSEKDNDIPISKENLKIDEQKEQGKAIYKENKKDQEDKTSYCHSILFEGEDIDIAKKQLLECLEQVGTNFILFKKKSKVKRLIYIDEQFLYILKEITVNNNNINNINMRRITRRYDLSKLCNIELNNEKGDFKFALHFLKNDYFDREIKTLFFKPEEGRIFYQNLADTIESIESTFFNDLFEYDEDDEEKEEDEDDENGVKEDSENDIDMSAKHMNNINIINDKNNDLDLISSSRKKIV